MCRRLGWPPDTAEHGAFLNHVSLGTPTCALIPYNLMTCLGLAVHIFYANNSGLQFDRRLVCYFLYKDHSGKCLVEAKLCPLLGISILYRKRGPKDAT